MGEYDLHSLILACNFRVDDVASIGAHHVVLYTSIWEPRRVLATIGIRQVGVIREVLRSPAMFEWFNISGADDIEKIGLHAPSPDDHVGRVVVGVMSSVDDVPSLMDKLHDGLERFKRGGVRKIWVYQALDDGRQVMILQEAADELAARQWIDHPDAAAEWMSHAGFGAYPTQFVGKFAHLMTIDGQG